MVSRLVVVAGPDKGRAFPLVAGAPFAIGRGATSHTRLVDLAVSRIHCEVRFDGGQPIVADAKSASGTFVNGQRIASHELQRGDVIKIGNTELRYEAEVTDETTIPPVAPPKGPVFAGKLGARVLPTALKELHALAGKALGSFQLLNVIGTGQVGVVFEARDTKDLKIVALKVLRPDFARDKKAVQRFIRGMKTARTLRHPHLVELYNAGTTGAYSWISMEHVEGHSVQQLTAAGQRDWKLALRVAIHIGEALQFVHEQGILHRNVMPQNILVQKSDGSAKLGDTMLAKALESTTTEDVTASGEFVGNMFYMAPERTVKNGEVDGRSDLYSLGVTAYSMLTGRMPFESGSLPEVITRIRQAVPPNPRTLEPSIPAAMEAIVLKTLAKQAKDRYPSAKEMLADLHRVAKAR